MTRINLLPWREERRQELKRQFFVILFGVALLGAGAVYLVEMNVQAKIAYQKGRNAFIETETRKLEAQIREIQELRKRREHLVERMNVIQDLQGNRPVIVYLFDHLVRTLPDGVFYESIESRGGALTVRGMAESNNRVSNLMRNLDASPLFVEPNLSSVKATPRAGEVWSSFQLNVKQGAPVPEQKGEG